MAHPNLKESRDGHNAKLRKMTTDYGSASGPANNIAAPTNRFKQEGPEEHVGFGADSTKPRGRADRASRKQMVSNPVATYSKGGAAKRASGGRTRHGGKGKGNHVNVIVAPQGGGGPGGMGRPPVAAVPPMLPGAPPPGAAMPPRPPMAPPPGAGGPPMGGPPGGLPMAPGAPGGLPPGIMPPRKRGGRVDHPDEKEDKALIHKILKDEGLERPAAKSDGGRMPMHGHKMTAGAASAEGRLQKIGEKPKKVGAAPERVQEV